MMFECGDLLKVTDDYVFGSFPKSDGRPFVRDKNVISSHPRYRCAFPKSSVLRVIAIVQDSDDIFILTSSITSGIAIDPTGKSEDIHSGDSVYFKYNDLRSCTDVMNQNELDSGNVK